MKTANLPGRRVVLALAAAAGLAPALPAMAADTASTLPLAAGARYVAKIDGVDFVATWVGAISRSSGGKEILTITGHVGEGASGAFINCAIVDPRVGTIPFGGSLMARTGCSFQNGTDVFESGFRFKQGSVEITEIDAGAHTISGRFTMTDARNMSGSRALKLAEGSFSKIPLDQQSRLK